MTEQTVFSRHFFRRTARMKRRSLEKLNEAVMFRVVKARRGPYRWYVVSVEPTSKSE
jgi:hypothetical protein